MTRGFMVGSFLEDLILILGVNLDDFKMSVQVERLTIFPFYFLKNYIKSKLINKTLTLKLLTLYFKK